MERKGIILAAGRGTRLHPMTLAVNKQLLPIYDKPMIYYPISTLMMAGIRDFLIITTPHEQKDFKRLLGDGSWIGVKFSYAVQPRPQGIAQAFLIGKKFIGKSSVALILGDNIFYGHGMQDYLRQAVSRRQGATIFGYPVKDPRRYGVVEFGADGRAISLVEKPKKPKSTYAVPGLYFYDNDVLKIASTLRPSDRGELEITDLNMKYLERERLWVERMGRGIAWLDTGTHESLLQASHFIQVIEERQGLRVSCLEEIAYLLGYIDAKQLKRLADQMKGNDYGAYLLRMLDKDYR
jgi:glucose-1-phosphate thymidylyltransferase